MSANAIIHQAQLNEWAARFADKKASGLTVNEWCLQNNLSQWSYFYWKRKLKEELISQALPEIVPLTLPVPECHSLPSASPVLGSTTCTTNTTDTARGSGTACATDTACTTASAATIRIHNTAIEINASAPENFIANLIKAVRHA